VVVWAALFLNVLAFGGTTILPIPRPVGQMITQGALVLALVLALTVNPGGLVRMNPFLILMTILTVVALMVSLHSAFFLGSLFRSSRQFGFVLVLWLLTPWWGRRDMLLLRCHRRVLWAILGSVVAGMAVAPGTAFAFEGRLSGVLWPIPPTQVAHYAGVLLGTSVILWSCRVISGRHTLVALAVTSVLLVLTHTRTALLGTALGLLIAGASLYLGRVRVRRVSAIGVVSAIGLATLFASELTTWMLRGQTTEEAGQLTGRTKVWTRVFEYDRPRLQDLFGSGLSNQSFDGLPIDSNWVATYLDQGWFGVVMQVSVVLVLLGAAFTRERSPQRGVALFLVAYCIGASFTETGLAGATPYLLDLAVAAALLAPEMHRRAS